MKPKSILKQNYKNTLRTTDYYILYLKICVVSTVEQLQK